MKAKTLWLAIFLLAKIAPVSLAAPDPTTSGPANPASQTEKKDGDPTARPDGTVDPGNTDATVRAIEPELQKQLDQRVQNWRTLLATPPKGSAPDPKTGLGKDAMSLIVFARKAGAQNPNGNFDEGFAAFKAKAENLHFSPEVQTALFRIAAILSKRETSIGADTKPTGPSNEETGTEERGPTYGNNTTTPGSNTSGQGNTTPTTPSDPSRGNNGNTNGGNDDPLRDFYGTILNTDSRNGSNNPAVINNSALYNCQYGNASTCYESSKKAVQRGSKNANVWVGYGASSYEMGDKAEAQRAGEKALEYDPDNENARKLAMLAPDHVTGDLSSVLKGVGFKSGGASMGAGAPDRALSKNTNFFGSSGFGGPSVSDGGRMTAAELAAIATKQAQMPASNVQQSAGLTREAGADLGVRDYQGAFNLASKAVELNPSNAQAWNFRAIADNHLQKYDDAVHDASFSLGLVPGNAPALQSRSWAFSKQGKYKEALADANFTLEKEPGNSFAYQNRAYALAGMGDRAGALEALRRSAELDPRFKEKYQAALQAPEANDLKFLFDDAPAARGAAAAAAAAGSSPAKQKSRFLRLFLLCISGGVLVALGLLHVVSASWREKVNTTIRRVLGTASEAAAAGAAEAVDGAAAAPGVLSQYQMVRQIGTGGMGVVFEAKDTSLDRTVAIKKMRDEFRAEPAERQRFVTEARVVAALHHPNIVDIYGILEDAGDVYLVFEYVAGRTLSDLLSEKGTLDFDAALKILRGACEAVDYAHRQRVIHRDIKPSNIMVANDGRVKVMDFGVARQAKDAITKMATMTNTVVGTPPYMAPEQEQGTVRKESDVFGLGVVFYELLSGTLPFQGHGAGMLLNKINGRINPLTQQVKYGLPAGLEDVIAKALAPDPEKRYRTPAEFLAAVEAVGSSRRG